MIRRLSIFVLILCIGAIALCNRRDQTTQRVRCLIADELDCDLGEIAADDEMGSLVPNRKAFMDIVHRIETEYRVSLPMENEWPTRRRCNAWKQTRVVDLANMVRPEWSRRVQEAQGDNAHNPGAD